MRKNKLTATQVLSDKLYKQTNLMKSCLMKLFLNWKEKVFDKSLTLLSAIIMKANNSLSLGFLFQSISMINNCKLHTLDTQKGYLTKHWKILIMVN